jgi:hypothetical protein
MAAPGWIELFTARLEALWREGHSEKHLRDIRAMLASPLELDRTFLERQVSERGLDDAWKKLVAQA